MTNDHSFFMPPEDSLSHRWYKENLMPHEAMLRAWLRASYPRESDIDDIVQEAVLRVLKARESSEVRSPKAFFFATARNLVLSGHRRSVRNTQLSLAEMDVLDVLDEGANVTAQVSLAEELGLLTEAIQSLPDRCRQIITLRKIYGMSQKEIAQQLGISENTVESQGTIGMHKLAVYFERLNPTRKPDEK